MTLGQCLDYVYGYELRQAKANHRARMIMAAFTGTSPLEIWPLFTDDLDTSEVSTLNDPEQIKLEIQSFFKR